MYLLAVIGAVANYLKPDAVFVDRRPHWRLVIRFENTGLFEPITVTRYSDN